MFENEQGEIYMQMLTKKVQEKIFEKKKSKKINS